MTKITSSKFNISPKELQNHLKKKPLIKGFPVVSRVYPNF